MRYEEYFHIPYKDLGRDIHGCDCYGLVYIMMQAELNKTIPLLDCYDSFNELGLSEYIKSSSKITEQWEVITNPKKSDVAIFKQHGLLQHVAFMIDGTNFIEMTRDNGVQVSQISRSNVRYNLAYFCRYIGDKV